MVSPAQRVAHCGLATASLLLGMLVLKWLPQIEIVTCLIFVFTFTLGFWSTLVASLGFVFVEGALYGFFAAWWFAYLIHWPLVVIVAWLCKRLTVKQYGCAIAAALVTVLFGINSTLLESIMYAMPFWARYIFGVPFFVIHVIGNFFIVLLIVPQIGRLQRARSTSPPAVASDQQHTSEQ